MALTPPTLTNGAIARVLAAFVIAAISATIGFIVLAVSYTHLTLPTNREV